MVPAPPTPTPPKRRRRLAGRLVLLFLLAAAAAWTGAQWRSRVLNARGLAAIERNDWAAAAAAFEAAAWWAPRRAEMLANVVTAREELGRHADAAVVARRLALLLPERAPSWTARAEALELAARYTDAARARVARMRAEGWNDDDTDLATTRAVAETLFQLGRYTDAILVYERALFKNPDDWGIEEWIQELERRVVEGEALTDDPDGPRAFGFGGADEPLRIVPGRR